MAADALLTNKYVVVARNLYKKKTYNSYTSHKKHIGLYLLSVWNSISVDGLNPLISRTSFSDDMESSPKKGNSAV